MQKADLQVAQGNAQKEKTRRKEEEGKKKNKEGRKKNSRHHKHVWAASSQTVNYLRVHWPHFCYQYFSYHDGGKG